jgi:chromosome segregation ATPase
MGYKLEETIRNVHNQWLNGEFLDGISLEQVLAAQLRLNGFVPYANIDHLVSDFASKVLVDDHERQLNTLRTEVAILQTRSDASLNHGLKPVTLNSTLVWLTEKVKALEDSAKADETVSRQNVERFKELESEVYRLRDQQKRAEPTYEEAMEEFKNATPVEVYNLRSLKDELDRLTQYVNDELDRLAQRVYGLEGSFSNLQEGARKLSETIRDM